MNASRPPEQWQVYDIVLHAPSCDAGRQRHSPRTITLFHNGVLIQDHVAIKEVSSGGTKDNVCEAGRLSYRTISIRTFKRRSCDFATSGTGHLHRVNSDLKMRNAADRVQRVHLWDGQCPWFGKDVAPCLRIPLRVNSKVIHTTCRCRQPWNLDQAEQPHCHPWAHGRIPANRGDVVRNAAFQCKGHRSSNLRACAHFLTCHRLPAVGAGSRCAGQPLCRNGHFLDS